MSGPATHLVRLEHAGTANLHLVGSKAANLGKLLRLGFAVPRGVCVTTAAYEYFIKNSGIFFELEETIPASHSAAHRASLNARQLIDTTEIPELLKRQIIHECQRLTEGKRAGFSFAVRSSSVDEDLANDSFAGLYDSYLHVSNFATVLQRIKDCWASFWSERALIYRMARGFSHRRVTGSVIIQDMVDAEAAGVLFTQNPIDNESLSMALEVVRGTGEKIVSGAVTPDRYVITKPALQIVSREIANLHEQSVFAASNGSAGSWRTLEASNEILSDREILDLCKMGLRIQDSFQGPQDIEWAKSKGDYYFLQTRPITSGHAEIADPDIWTRNNINERFPERLKPLEASLVGEWVFAPGCSQLFRSLGCDAAKGREVFRTFHGYAYVNKKLFASALKGVPEIVTKQLFDRNGNSTPLPQINFTFPLLLTFSRFLRIILTNHRQFRRKLPLFLERYRYFRSCNYDHMQLRELGSSLAALGGEIQTIAAGHMQSIVAAEILLTALTAMCSDKNVLLLIRGLVENKTVEMNRRFEDLCKIAETDEAVYRILTTQDSEQALRELKCRPQAQPFLWLFNWFLEDYGHRSTMYQLSHPRWREKPSQVVEMIKGSIAAQSHCDLDTAPGGDLGDLAKSLERDLSASHLDRFLPWKKFVFQWLLRYARIYCGILRENEGFYITMPFPEVKRIICSISRLLTTDGVLDDESDIYYLAIPEILQFANFPGSEDLRQTVTVRKQEYLQALPERNDATHSCRTVLSGTAASPGIASGPAYVVSDPAEGFEPGSILVTHSLNAAWVPILRSARGVVTNVGGMLSHAAVLAREFRVPAVLGARAATLVIQHGQVITVDGTSGKVLLTNQ